MSSNEPLYQVDIEQHLLNLGRRLETEVEAFSKLTVDRAEAEAEYKRLYHRALIQSPDGTVSKKESLAHLASASAFHAWKIAEAQEKATQQKLMALRTQIDSTRTMAANVRAAGG
ncbi:MAG: hypothetical protein ACR2NF_03795 [Pirellulales bacterium]|tara:strand:+ start:1230 stop:1574 length:345 start_codon:yes stop_codon:yes gene_type:complete